MQIRQNGNIIYSANVATGPFDETASVPLSTLADAVAVEHQVGPAKRRVELVERLATHAPAPGVHRVQLYSSGAEAVESALRLAKSLDDVAANRELVRAMLTPFGHHITEAASGAEAVRETLHREFDLILMDLQMPGMDGLAATRAMCGFALGRLGLHRLEAACIPENDASRRLLLKAGFELEGRAQAYLKINGDWRDHLLFGLVTGAGLRGSTDT